MKRSLKEIIVRLLILTVGLFIANSGIAVLIATDLGADPFDVFVQGLFRTIDKFGIIPGLTHGKVFTVLCLLLILIYLIVDKTYIKIGTVFCMLVGGAILDFWNPIISPIVSSSAPMAIRILAVVIGCIFTACGMSIVIKSDAGTGPNDLVAVIISDKLKKKFSIVRVIVDVTFVVIGFLLGGTFNIGTIISALIIGPIAGFIMPKVEKPINSIIEKTTGAKAVKLETIDLKNKNGMTVSILQYGATVQAIRFPDGRDVVLGYDDLESYKKGESYFGATVGRTAGLVANAEFTLNGETYKLAKNAGEHCLHGGVKGFNSKVFDIKNVTENSVDLHYLSPDMEENYPGNLDLTVSYKLDDDNALWIHYDAVSDKDTLVNLTNHSYFNLDGQDSNTIHDHYLMMDSDRYCIIQEDGTATGEIASVDGTPMDFRTPKKVGADIDGDFRQVQVFGGYDHSYELNPGSIVNGQLVKPCMVVENGDRTHRLEVFTDYPGVQFYAGNSLGDGDIGKNGKKFVHRQALCLETQYFSDAPSNPNFPSIVLEAGKRYEHTTVYRFNS